MNRQREGNRAAFWDMIRDQAETEVEGVCVGTFVVCEWAAGRVSGMLSRSGLMDVSECSPAAHTWNSKKWRRRLWKEEVRESQKENGWRRVLTLPGLHLGSCSFLFFLPLTLSPSNLSRSVCLPARLSVCLSVCLSLQWVSVSPSVMKAHTSQTSKWEPGSAKKTIDIHPSLDSPTGLWFPNSLMSEGHCHPRETEGSVSVCVCVRVCVHNARLSKIDRT